LIIERTEHLDSTSLLGTRQRPGRQQAAT
jgi:hypothetical protein